MLVTLTLLWTIFQSFSILTEAQTCRGLPQYSPCSSNPDCGCLRFTSASDENGICAYLHLNATKLRSCHDASYYCDHPYTVCVHHPRLESSKSLCYPTGMASQDICPSLPLTSPPTPPEPVDELCGNVTWAGRGVTVAGSNYTGSQLQQLRSPTAMFIDPKDNSLYIADNGNQRIVKWATRATSGVVVAGDKKEGSELDQFGWISDLLINKKDRSLVICDARNRRVVRWLRNATQATILIGNISCSGLTLDEQGSLYVTDGDQHRVTKWTIGKQNATGGQIVVGGNGKGTGLNQLNQPSGIFVDSNRTIFVADFSNDRIVKWQQGAKEGTLVGKLRWPRPVLVDQSGSIYSIDGYYAQVMRWTSNDTQGTVIIGGRPANSTESNMLSQPYDLSLDKQSNLYVVNFGNGRVDKFTIDKSACL